MPLAHRRHRGGLRAASGAPLQRVTQAGDQEPADEGGIAEAHLGLGRVDVDVDLFGGNLQEQGQDGVTIARQHVGIGAAHRADQQAVLHRAAIDEQVLVIGDPAIEGRQPRDAGQPRDRAGAEPPLRLDRHALVGQFAGDQLGDPPGQALAPLDRQGTAPVVFQHEAHVGPRHGQAADDVEAGGIFGAGGTEELAAGRDAGKQVRHADAGARRQCGGSVQHHVAVIDHPLPPLGMASGPALDGQPGDAGDRRQGLAAETQGGDQLDRLVGQLGRGVALQRERHLRPVHAAAVIRDLDQVESATGQPHRDLPRPGIDRVLDQLLQGGRRTLDHLARGDAVDQGLRQAADRGHRAVLGRKGRERHQLTTKRPEFEPTVPPVPAFRDKILAFAAALR